MSEAQANRRGARRPAEDLDPRRARSAGYHWASVHGCGQAEARHFRVMSRSRHSRSGAACPSRTSLTVTGMVMTASCSDALSRRKAPDPSWCRRPWCIPPPNRTATPLGPATQGYAATTRRAVVPARRPSSPAARSHRCAPTQRPPSGAIMITPTFRPKSGADRWSVTSLAGRMVAIVNLGRWVSRLDGRERLEDLVGVHSVPGNDPAVAWLQ